MLVLCHPNSYALKLLELHFFLEKLQCDGFKTSKFHHHHAINRRRCDIANLQRTIKCHFESHMLKVELHAIFKQKKLEAQLFYFHAPNFCLFLLFTHTERTICYSSNSSLWVIHVFFTFLYLLPPFFHFTNPTTILSLPHSYFPIYSGFRVLLLCLTH